MTIARAVCLVAIATLAAFCGGESESDSVREDAARPDASLGGAAGGNSGGGATSGGSAGTIASGGSSVDAGDASTCDTAGCQQVKCQGKVLNCGDCDDNDSDGLVDMDDPDCVGPCDYAEEILGSTIPGQPGLPCKLDCAFDMDLGSGNDECYWTHQCDPLEVAPDYPPEGSVCAYQEDAGVPGTSSSCAELKSAQSPLCSKFCGAITPNGCDCFGCCEVPGLAYAVWITSGDSTGILTCSADALSDPTQCRPCTIVPSCFNPCTECEYCFAKPTLSATCTENECPSGSARCQSSCDCGPSAYCLMGCCTPAPV